VAAVAVSLEDLFSRLQGAARLAEKVHRENFKLFVEEAQRLLSQGDVRDAAEKAWAAYKSLLGFILATRGLGEIETRIQRTWEKKGPEKALEEARWWSETGLLVPSAKGKLERIIELLVEATGDKELDRLLDTALNLHLWFYHGPDIVPLSEDKVRQRIEELLEERKPSSTGYSSTYMCTT